jgi:hypothetical protein
MTTSAQLQHIPGMPALQEVFGAEFMSKCIAPLLGDSADVRMSGARLVGGRSGERAVIAYDTVNAEGNGRVLIGKVFADHGRARRLHGLLEALYQTSFADGDYRVPHPLAHVAELGMVIYEAASGRPLDHLDRTERNDGVVAAARWLVKLHGSAVEFDRTLDLGVETRNLALWAALVAKERPHAERAAGRLLERLGSLADGLDVQTSVPIHKDFQYQHTLFNGSQVTVIDLDEARAGDAAFDVAHFAANLRLLALRERTSSDEPFPLESAFLDAYGSAAGYEIDERHDFFHAYACLKMAKQLVTGRGPSPVPAGAERGRQVDLILGEGLRCPSR